MPFHNGADAAVSLQFDDSMQSQISNALPLLDKYKIPATFFINPGRDDYPGMSRIWEKDVERAGHELGNHTWSHNGAVDRAHAEEEIHHLSSRLLDLHHGKTRIVPFAVPGGVPWNVTPEELHEILVKDNMFLATERQFFQDSDATDPTLPAKKALEQKAWGRMGFHGVGGQWLSTSTDNLARVLDYLSVNSDKIWVATTGDVYKYIQERDAALPILITSPSQRGFNIEVRTDPAKNPFGASNQAIFDAPLTVRCKVPDTWTGFTVHEASKTVFGSTTRIGGQNYAQFDVVPNTGRVKVTGSKD